MYLREIQSWQSNPIVGNHDELRFTVRLVAVEMGNACAHILREYISPHQATKENRRGKVRKHETDNR